MSKDKLPDVPYNPQSGDTQHAHRLDTKPSPYDPRDYIAEATPTDLAKLPTMAMIQKRPKHHQQGQQGSCTGNAFAGMTEMMRMGAGQPYEELSAAFVYIEERDREHTANEDSGAYPRDGCYTLKHYGIPSDAVMPYSDQDFTTQPSAAAFADAATRKIKAYYRVLSLHSIKAWIAKGIPINMGFLVFQGMEQSRNGVIPMPAAGEQALGGHDIVIDGYCDRPDWPGGGYFRLFNSWGEDAGSGGDYFMPYAMAGNAQIAFEFWRIVLP